MTGISTATSCLTESHATVLFAILMLTVGMWGAANYFFGGRR